MAAKRGLLLADVIAAAASLADSAGVEAVTMAAVAARLGVRSPSLYSHVDGLTGLRRMLALEAARRLGAVLGEAVSGRDGVDAVRRIANAYRAFSKEHPGLYAMLLSTPPRETDQEVYDAFATQVTTIGEVLIGVGVEERDVVAVVRSFRSALHGFVSLEAGGGFGLPESVDDSFEMLVNLLVAGIVSFGTSSRPISRAASRTSRVARE
jgi:AcrR family transcriptional regulator